MTVTWSLGRCVLFFVCQSGLLSCPVFFLAVLTTLTDRQADRQADSSALTAAAAASVSRDVVADDAVSAAATANVLSWCTIGAQPTHTHTIWCGRVSCKRKSIHSRQRGRREEEEKEKIKGEVIE